MYLQIETSDVIEECLTIDVDGVQVYPAPLTEDQQKAETLRCCKERMEKFQHMFRNIKEQDVSAQLAELTSKGGDV